MKPIPLYANKHYMYIKDFVPLKVYLYFIYNLTSPKLTFNLTTPGLTLLVISAGINHHINNQRVQI